MSLPLIFRGQISQMWISWILAFGLVFSLRLISISEVCLLFILTVGMIAVFAVGRVGIRHASAVEWLKIRVLVVGVVWIVIVWRVADLGTIKVFGSVVSVAGVALVIALVGIISSAAKAGVAVLLRETVWIVQIGGVVWIRVILFDIFGNGLARPLIDRIVPRTVSKFRLVLVHFQVVVVRLKKVAIKLAVPWFFLSLLLVYNRFPLVLLAHLLGFRGFSDFLHCFLFNQRVVLCELDPLIGNITVGVWVKFVLRR